MTNNLFLNGTKFEIPDKKYNILNLVKSLKNILLNEKAVFTEFNDYIGINKILFILMDGVGYDIMKNVFSKLSYPTPRMITSIYPSTTAAVLTTISTLSLPGKHGLLEWNLYIPEINMLVESIPFRPIGSKYMDELENMGYSPKVLFYGRRLTNILYRKGIKVRAYVRGYIVNSCYSKNSLVNADRVPYINVTDMIVRLKRDLQKCNANLYYVYIEAADAIAHLYGYSTLEQETDIKYTLYIIKKELINKLPNEALEDLLIIIASDHGLVTINPEKVIYLNKILNLKNYLRKDIRNIPLVSGSPRNVYLHVKKEFIDRVKRKLEDKIGSIALILDKKEFLKSGLLGQVNKRVLERIGDIIILPYNHVAIWFEHLKGRKIKIRGFHGGLSKNEVKISYVLIDSNDIKRGKVNSV